MQSIFKQVATWDLDDLRVGGIFRDSSSRGMFAYGDLVTVAQAFQNMAEGGLENSQCKRNKRKEANNLQIITNTEKHI